MNRVFRRVFSIGLLFLLFLNAALGQGSEVSSDVIHFSHSSELFNCHVNKQTQMVARFSIPRGISDTWLALIICMDSMSDDCESKEKGHNVMMSVAESLEIEVMVVEVATGSTVYDQKCKLLGNCEFTHHRLPKLGVSFSSCARFRMADELLESGAQFNVLREAEEYELHVTIHSPVQSVSNVVQFVFDHYTRTNQ